MPVDVALETIRKRLSDRPYERVTGEVRRRAAVAAVLRAGASDTELLLIRRAERHGDPWSGHMAFPGGHHDVTDADLLATARRETLEEVGLDLREHELLGALDEHAATNQGGFTGMVIAPFVFALSRDAALQANRDEVADMFWTPLGSLARGEVDVFKELQRDGRVVRFPGFGVGDQVVWGLTHRLLQNLFEVLRR